MDNYLIDRGTLGKFIDELIKKKPLPVDDVDELNKLREENIKLLDDEIGKAILAALSEEQREEFDQLLDSSEDSEDMFNEFFKKYDINLEKIITETMQTFGANFLGGENV